MLLPVMLLCDGSFMMGYSCMARTQLYPPIAYIHPPTHTRARTHMYPRGRRHMPCGQSAACHDDWSNEKFSVLIFMVLFVATVTMLLVSCVAALRRRMSRRHRQGRHQQEGRRIIAMQVGGGDRVNAAADEARQHIELIADLKKTKIRKPLAASQSTCSICFEELKPGQQVFDLACVHTFHMVCVRGWWGGGLHTLLSTCLTGLVGLGSSNLDRIVQEYVFYMCEEEVPALLLLCIRSSRWMHHHITFPTCSANWVLVALFKRLAEAETRVPRMPLPGDISE